MRINILAFFMLIIVVGCNTKSTFSRFERTNSHVNEIPTTNHFRVVLTQTPNFINSKSAGNLSATRIFPNSTTVPPVDFTETYTFQSSENWVLSKGSVSDTALELLGMQARGHFIVPGVPLISQPDYTSCGEAAFAMGWNYKHPEWAVDTAKVRVIGQSLNAYFPSRSPTPHGYLGTPPSVMEQIGNYYAREFNTPLPTVGNIDVDKGGAYARLEAKGLLFNQLSKGNPVIIEVTDLIGNPNRIYNDSHYVIVTGMNFDTGMLTFNDPLVNLSMSGKYSGLGRLAEWSQIFNSWFTNLDINPGEEGHPGRGWYMIVH